MLEQPGNPKRAWLGSPDGTVDSCVPPDIRAASLSSGRKGSSLTSKPITAALITFQLAKIPVGWWAGQKWRGRDRAGGNIEPALQRETHPNPEALLVPLAIVRVPRKRRPKDSLLDEKSLMLRTPAMLPGACCVLLVHVPIFPAPHFFPNPLIFMLVRMAISPSHGHWDQGSTSQPQLKQEGFFPGAEVIPVFPYHVSHGKGSKYLPGIYTV